MPNWALPSFLAQPHPSGNALLVFGGLLLAGLLAASLVTRSRWLPRLTAYFLVGLALGSSGLNLLAGDVLDLASTAADLASALMVFQLGRYVDFGWLRRERWLLATVAVVSLLCVAFVGTALMRFGFDPRVALLAAVFAIGTGPAVVMVIVRDAHAEGQLTRRLAATAALNNLVALAGAYILLPAVSLRSGDALMQQVGHTVYTLLGALVLAFVMLQVLLGLARLIGREPRRQYLLVIAVITLLVGFAKALQLPLLLVMLSFSILSRNADADFAVAELELGPAGELLVVMLFVTLGASVQASMLPALLPAVGALLAMRTAAIVLGTMMFARVARLSQRQAGLLAIASLPMTEAGLGLLQVAHLYPQTAAAVAPLIAASLAIMEVIGPLATQFALNRSGETSSSHQP